MNAATKVAEYFSEDTEQVNCEMHQLNTAMKYGFGLLEKKDRPFSLMQMVSGSSYLMGNSSVCPRL
jgi:hypothetical protein